MRQLVYPRDVRAMPLLEELQAAGVPVRAVRPEADEQGAPRVTIEVEDGADNATVAATVAAHDAAAIDAAEAANKQADTDDRGVVRLSVAVLLADIARLEDTTQAMTVQVVRNHLARTDKALVALLRHLVRLGQT